MAAPRYEHAALFVQLLDNAGIKATRNPAAALAQLPCVLIPPPILADGTYSGPTLTWQLVAIAKDPLGGDKAWSQLDELLEAVWDALPCERAEPFAYQLPTGGDPLPAYRITLTES